MKNVFRIVLIASLCLWGCDDSGSPDESSPKRDSTCSLETCDGAKVCLMSDALHCGKCGNECPEGVPCVDGECTKSSTPPDPESKECDGKLCNAECVDIKTDVRHCGDCDQACGDNQHCSEAKCACDDPLTMCSDVCVDVKTDKDNCGECGVKCGEGLHCSDAKCVCDDPQTMCSDICVDVKTDNNNCGACGTQCGEGLHCSDAKCVCDEPLMMCSDVCVDVKTDKTNCGACGTQCGEGQHCGEMKCACDDPALTACSDVCVDVKTDKTNCGACGTKCGESQHCSDMKCACDDPALTACSDACVNIKTDKNNCGACGTQCGAEQRCKDGGCKAKATGGEAAIEYAEQFVYEDTHMCTYDHFKAGSLPGFADFAKESEVYNCGYNMNCANFVVTVLRNTNELTQKMFEAIPVHLRYSVEGVRMLCEELNVGYRVIQAKNAQAGDIWYWKEDEPEKHSHTELVIKVEGDKLTTIGSTNFDHNMSTLPCKTSPNPDCKHSYSTDSHSYQAVMISTRSITGGKVCSKR